MYDCYQEFGESQSWEHRVWEVRTRCILRSSATYDMKAWSIRALHYKKIGALRNPQKKIHQIRKQLQMCWKFEKTNKKKLWNLSRFLWCARKKKLLLRNLFFKFRRAKRSFVRGYETESETNRTFPIRVRFGSTELSKSRFGFGSVRFIFQNVRSGFGSVRLEPNRTVLVRFGSVRFRSLIRNYESFVSNCIVLYKTHIWNHRAQLKTLKVLYLLAKPIVALRNLKKDFSTEGPLFGHTGRIFRGFTDFFYRSFENLNASGCFPTSKEPSFRLW